MEDVVKARIDKVLDNTDLVLLDFKHMIEEEAKNLTGVGIEKTIKLAKHLDVEQLIQDAIDNMEVEVIEF